MVFGLYFAVLRSYFTIFWVIFVCPDHHHHHYWSIDQFHIYTCRYNQCNCHHTCTRVTVTSRHGPPLDLNVKDTQLRDLQQQHCSSPRNHNNNEIFKILKRSLRDERRQRRKRNPTRSPWTDFSLVCMTAKGNAKGTRRSVVIVAHI